MTLLTTITLEEAAGTTVTTTSANSDSSGGDTFTYNNNTMLYVANASGSSVTVTIAVQNASAFIPGAGTLTKADIEATVADGTFAILDSRSVSYRDTSGLVNVAYSSDTSVTVAAIEADRV